MKTFEIQGISKDTGVPEEEIRESLSIHNISQRVKIKEIKHPSYQIGKFTDLDLSNIINMRAPKPN